MAHRCSIRKLKIKPTAKPLQSHFYGLKGFFRNVDLAINFLRDRNIKVEKIGPNQIRLVVHYLITDDAVDYVVGTFRNVLEERSSR